MKQVKLPGATLTCSRFIFGCASLFNVGGQKQRLALLNAAVENGFTHFDTAPYYGFGMAERDISSVLRAYSHVTITTKVGIYSPGGESQSYPEIFMRKAIGRVWPAIAKPTVSFELARARNALEGSLRRLRRDHVELYMLHEPEIEMVRTDEWRNWLDGLVKTGTIGSYGLAATVDRLDAFLRRAPELANLVQVLDSLDAREADTLSRFGKPMQITYGYVSAAHAKGDKRPVGEILRHALRRNRDGAIIVSTKRVERLSQYAKLVEEQS